jgi:hypothetical protein
VRLAANVERVGVSEIYVRAGVGADDVAGWAAALAISRAAPCR